MVSLSKEGRTGESTGAPTCTHDTEAFNYYEGMRDRERERERETEREGESDGARIYLTPVARLTKGTLRRASRRRAMLRRATPYLTPRRDSPLRHRSSIINAYRWAARMFRHLRVEMTYEWARTFRWRKRASRFSIPAPPREKRPTFPRKSSVSSGDDPIRLA